MIASFPVLSFFPESASGPAEVCDFLVGNPHEMPLEAYAEALQRWTPPRHELWYAYKRNEPEARAVVAGSLRAWRGMPFEADDIFMTNGAIAALHVLFSTLVDPGDEVICIAPAWFEYEGMILHAGGVPVKVCADVRTYDLDVPAIERAITPRTRVVVVNSPNNPSGRIYPPETLTALASVLHAASMRNGRTVYLISDEAYSRIVFDGLSFVSPTQFYHNSFLVYTYGKALLTPGERIGYIAMPPTMPDRQAFRDALPAMQMFCGWAFPNAVLQYALADIDKLVIDLARLQRRRDLLVGELRRMGYETTLPDGAVYVLVRSPWADDGAFVRLLAEYGILCLPGSVMDIPGWLRLSLTASDEMVQRSLPSFAAALRRSRQEERGEGRDAVRGA
jgi:aspartate aminotransferase